MPRKKKTETVKKTVKPVDVKKSQAENNEIKNAINRTMTRNGNYYPTELTNDDIYWQMFTEKMYYNERAKLKNRAMKTFKWDVSNCKTLNPRVIEWGYLTRGNIVIFKDPLYKWLSLPCTPSYFNIYGDPTRVNAYGYNGWQEQIDIKYFKDETELPALGTQYPLKNKREGVFSRDNWDEKPYIYYVDQTARILADLKGAIYVCAQRLKDPYIIAIAERAVKQIVNKVVKNIKDNKPSMVVIKEDPKTMNGGSVKEMLEKVDLSGNPESAKNLMEIYNFFLYDYLELIGINTNPTTNKTQYNNTHETDANNSDVDLLSDIRFDNRKQLCEDLKEIFDIDISVEKNIDEVKQQMSMKGDYDNGMEFEQEQTTTE